MTEVHQMSVILSSGGRVKPGRYSDFLSQASQANKIYQRLGTRPPRLLTAGLAGEAFGTWTFSVEFEDLDSFGAISDEYQSDPEAQAFMFQLQDETNPSTLEQVNVCLEVPVRESKGGRGSIVALYASKIHPGALERGLDLGARSCEFAEANGALDARMFNLIGSGSGTGVTVTMWELDSMRSYAKVIDAFTNEPAGQAIATAAASADTPVTGIFEAVYTEIPT
jgi:hypothetical protein